MAHLNSGNAAAITATIPTLSVGDLVAVIVFARYADSGVTLTDSSGNTWTASPNNDQVVAPSQVSAWVFWSIITTAGSSVVLTVHSNTSTAPGIIWTRHSGLTALDVQGSNLETTNATGHSGGGCTTTGQTETLICLNCQSSISSVDTYTPGSGFTIPSGGQLNDPSVSHTGFIQYQTGVLTGSQSNGFNSALSSTFAGFILGFKETGWSSGGGSPILIVQAATGSSPSLSTVDCTITGVTAGNTLIALGAFWSGSSGIAHGPPVVNDTTLSIALTAAQNPTGTNNAALGTNLESGIWFLPGSSVTAGTHTIEADTSSMSYNLTKANLTVIEVSGLAASPYDVGANSIGSTGQSLTAGPTATMAQAAAIAFAVLAQRSATGVTNASVGCSGYTDLFNDSNTSDGLGSEHCYQILNVIGTPQAAFSWSDSSTAASQACIAVFKASGGGGASVRQMLMLLGVGS